MDRLETVARLRERLGDRAWAIVALSPFWFFFGFHELLAPAQLSEGTPIEMIPGGGSAARRGSAPPRMPWCLRRTSPGIAGRSRC